MARDGLCSIGELAALAGVTVKTVRFYSDRGLLPETARTHGGHRLYGPGALDRLRLIRSLRALDLPLPQIERVLAAQDEAQETARDAAGGPDGSVRAAAHTGVPPAVPARAQTSVLEDALARRLREVGSRLAVLRWQEAALRLLHEPATPGELAQRLGLVASVAAAPTTAPLARFWRQWLRPARLPAALTDRIVDRAVPQLPADPAPAHVLAFARLHALVAEIRPEADKSQPVAHRPGSGWRPEVLYPGLMEAFALAAPHVRTGRPPGPGDALDCFVAAHARAHPDTPRDTPAFRRRLAVLLTSEPRVDRYWALTAELSGSPATPGAAHTWLSTALTAPSA
ncbi:MerR family transcriptional regulator [Streptomyces sp. HPF1205]|uniref:MerR family transcriptional regulator n=1 Tax=Streptomyces sp. HPF1205 TaxID=2873262 RepID=UPI001CEC6109|nr:MerR family transcriptional regulator [Streptomyces sp. HPF1205]